LKGSLASDFAAFEEMGTGRREGVVEVRAAEKADDGGADLYRSFFACCLLSVEIVDRVGEVAGMAARDCRLAVVVAAEDFLGLGERPALMLSVVDCRLGLLDTSDLAGDIAVAAAAAEGCAILSLLVIG
jgi:hypothetical protein